MLGSNSGNHHPLTHMPHSPDADGNGDLDMLIDQEDSGEEGEGDGIEGDPEGSVLQIQAEAAARAAEEAMRFVEPGRGFGKG